jgi:hypothetical protein
MPGVHLLADSSIQRKWAIERSLCESYGRPYGTITLEDLQEYSAAKLLGRSTIGIGPASVDQLRTEMAKYGLALKGEIANGDNDYELDQVALALRAFGTQGIIAKSGKDGNSFPLQLTDLHGLQFELRRTPAMTKRTAVDLIKDFRELHRSPSDSPEALDILELHAVELGRSRIKSIMVLKTITCFGEIPTATELKLANGQVVGREVHKLEEVTFSGRNWVLVVIENHPH